MSPEVSERSFEAAIECGLLANGPDACPGWTSAVRETVAPYGDAAPGGYRRRAPEAYDRGLCLIPQEAIDFILATQPREWEKLKQHHGADVQERFLSRLAAEIESRGALDVLRHGLKDSGCKFHLAYFRPASGLNDEQQRLYRANLFSVVRQLHYSLKTDQSLDLAIFLNGIPIFTAEVKNPLTGQTVEDAMRQYRRDRDPREALFRSGRALAHFAVDPNLVYVTTLLDGAATRFLPFNQGHDRRAGNPPVPPTSKGYATAYLWEETWARDSVLDLIRQFIHEMEDGSAARRFLIFPRYQQLDAVRRLVAHARAHGTNQRYLIQHSAGSGKSFTIAWLAHQLSVLHDSQDQRVFDTIVVVTDRRVLDRQLQHTIRQFEQVLGVVENIDTTSRQLKEALESGKTIIVTTLQKFPVIAKDIKDLPGKRFAVIVDEAHSSQSGETSKSLKAVLAAKTLEEAEREEANAPTSEDEVQDTVTEELTKRKLPTNVSMFAFTATPKAKTLELFGTKLPDGSFGPFHLYSMQQAIDEGFILDVLQSYTTYKAYWRLLKTIEGDPHYDRNKASYLLKSFVELSPHAIDAKIRIIVDHFAANVQDKIAGRAKAMVVTRSRLHAVRYKLALDRYLLERQLPFKALVAFSGTVSDGGQSHTEGGMNGFSDRQTAQTFEQPEYRFLVVAEKFQTGFDQPLLYAMYVDKKLADINAVQTLSRLNRVHPDKDGTTVLDFSNEADAIRDAFKDYCDVTLLSEGTDPNQLYDLQTRLLAFGVFAPADVQAFAAVYFDPKATQDRLYAVLAPVHARFPELSKVQQADFRGQLTDYVRLYAFLGQVLTFADPDLEKFYVFARHLRRLIPADRDELPLEVQQNIDMESYRLQQTGSGKISLPRQVGRLDPIRTMGRHAPSTEELEPLSQIIAELNERFGLSLGPEQRGTLGQMMAKLEEDPALEASARVNTRENVRLTFDNKVESVIQQIVDSNFDLYKRITDDPAFGEAVKNLLFDQYLRTHRQAEDLLKQQESKTLEFKSTLRWSLKENREDNAVTFAVLKTIAAFLNTEGGDLLIGVADDRTVVGIDPDNLENDDKFMRHLMQVVRNGLGDRAGTCLDPNTQVVQGKVVCLVSCQRSPEPVFLKWKGMNKEPDGDFFVRNGPGTVKLTPESATKYIAARFKS